jgi:hypothetical protein
LLPRSGGLHRSWPVAAWNHGHVLSPMLSVRVIFALHAAHVAVV